MKSSFFVHLRGCVLVEVRGKQLERLINLMVRKRLAVWDIRFSDETVARMYVGLSDFFRLRPLLKETGCRTRVKERHGFPFFLVKLGKRKFFAAGLVGFMIGIYLLSSLVWQVRVEGNETIETSRILQEARQMGIYKLQWKFRLKDPEALSRQLHAILPGTAWVGVEISGTHVIIKVVESKLPETQPLNSPRHIIAGKSAMITNIFAEKGKPLVKANTYVRKGDILISGVIGDEVNRQTVVASGKVKGLVWYTPKVEVPLTQTYKVYTGEVKKRFYVVFGSRGVQVTGYGKVPFEQFETVPQLRYLQWRNWTLPVGWLNERVMEVGFAETPVDPKEAKQIGLERARAEILAEAGADARVASEKILHEKTENGKVYMEVHFEVEEYIGEELPIVP